MHHRSPWLSRLLAAATCLQIASCTDAPAKETPDAAPPADPDAAPIDPACPPEEMLWEDIEFATFTETRVPDPDPVVLTGDAVSPAEPATYWELRTYGDFSTTPKILISAGEKCAAATDPDACRVTFDALEPSMEGFGQNDGPDHYHSHLIVNRGDTTVFLSTRDELVAFLGDVDTPMEAALVTFADGLSVSNARAVAGGHEVLASEITAWCKPVITQRVLVLVSADGKAEELRRQNAHVECNVCI